jgi:hypothetical protein
MVAAALLGMAAPEAAVAGLGYLGSRALPALKPLLRGTAIGAGFESAGICTTCSVARRRSVEERIGPHPAIG